MARLRQAQPERILGTGGTKGGRNSQYPIFGSTTGRIAALLLACVARHTALRAPCTASRQRTKKRYIGYFRLLKANAMGSGRRDVVGDWHCSVSPDEQMKMHRPGFAAAENLQAQRLQFFIRPGSGRLEVNQTRRCQ